MAVIFRLFSYFRRRDIAFFPSFTGRLWTVGEYSALAGRPSVLSKILKGTIINFYTEWTVWTRFSCICFSFLFIFAARESHRMHFHQKALSPCSLHAFSKYLVAPTWWEIPSDDLIHQQSKHQPSNILAELHGRRELSRFAVFPRNGKFRFFLGLFTAKLQNHGANKSQDDDARIYQSELAIASRGISSSIRSIPSERRSICCDPLQRGEGQVSWPNDQLSVISLLYSFTVWQKVEWMTAFSIFLPSYPIARENHAEEFIPRNLLNYLQFPAETVFGAPVSPTLVERWS